MEWLTLTLSIIGTVTGVGSLAWQVRTFRRGGHRVIVTVQAGMMLHDMYAGKSHGPFVQVTASNVGSAPVNVASWSIRYSDGTGAMQVAAGEFPPEVPLPHRLEAGASVLFFMRQDRMAAESGGKDLSGARAVVILATGQRVTSKRMTVKSTGGVVKS